MTIPVYLAKLAPDGPRYDPDQWGEWLLTPGDEYPADLNVDSRPKVAIVLFKDGLCQQLQISRTQFNTEWPKIVAIKLHCKNDIYGTLAVAQVTGEEDAGLLTLV